MVTKSLLFVLLCVVVGCETEAPMTKVFLQPICVQEQVEQRADFIIDCVKAGTPHSAAEDESLGSHLVYQCSETSEEVYCLTQQPVVRIEYVDYQCWYTGHSEARKVCDQHGYHLRKEELYTP